LLVEVPLGKLRTVDCEQAASASTANKPSRDNRLIFSRFIIIAAIQADSFIRGRGKRAAKWAAVR
jgi:hypothetical protein